mmetsp:Transcript_12692/g.32328  ORF Transcript_12692/g.32328 Transcript_12692/m.32328 type:complete len:360 (-) Transcript_12692:538-1617(-)
MHGTGGHAMHVRLADDLHLHRNAVLPDADGLVAAGGDEAALVAHEGDGVHRLQMPVVLLHHLLGARVPLHHLVVALPAQELVVVLGIGVEAHADRHPALAKVAQTLAGLGVPQLHLPIHRGAQELPSVVVERDVTHVLLVPQIGAHTAPVVVHIPDLHLAVHARRQQQMRALREEADLRHTLGVARVRVHSLLGQEGVRHLPQPMPQLRGRIHKGAALVVVQRLLVQDAPLLANAGLLACRRTRTCALVILLGLLVAVSLLLASLGDLALRLALALAFARLALRRRRLLVSMCFLAATLLGRLLAFTAAFALAAGHRRRRRRRACLVVALCCICSGVLWAVATRAGLTGQYFVAEPSLS